MYLEGWLVQSILPLMIKLELNAAVRHKKALIVPVSTGAIKLGKFEIKNYKYLVCRQTASADFSAETGNYL